MSTIRVAVVEDENLMREALVTFLSTSPDLAIVGTHPDEAGAGARGLQLKHGFALPGP